jgi:hypothetical protein
VLVYIPKGCWGVPCGVWCSPVCPLTYRQVCSW